MATTARQRLRFTPAREMKPARARSDPQQQQQVQRKVPYTLLAVAAVVTAVLFGDHNPTTNNNAIVYTVRTDDKSTSLHDAAHVTNKLVVNASKCSEVSCTAISGGITNHLFRYEVAVPQFAAR